MKQKIQAALKDAMRAKDKVKLETIRSLISAIQYEEIEKKVEPLPDDACLSVIQREHKKRKEEVDFAKQAGRNDLLAKLESEIATIETFLPKQMAMEDLEKIISEFKAQNLAANLGTAMKLLKEKYAGQYDSKAASEIAKRIFG